MYDKKGEKNVCLGRKIYECKNIWICLILFLVWVCLFMWWLCLKMPFWYAYIAFHIHVRKIALFKGELSKLFLFYLFNNSYVLSSSKRGRLLAQGYNQPMFSVFWWLQNILVVCTNINCCLSVFQVYILKRWILP